MSSSSSSAMARRRRLSLEGSRFSASLSSYVVVLLPSGELLRTGEEFSLEVAIPMASRQSSLLETAGGTFRGEEANGLVTDDFGAKKLEMVACFLGCDAASCFIFAGAIVNGGGDENVARNSDSQNLGSTLALRERDASAREHVTC